MSMTGDTARPALSTGTRIGPYEVVSAIGAGGMGEVYRAHDTKLDRDVALKILPASFASDPDRLMRFEREAKTLAALNHPNIAAIYGIEEADGVRALVMELVEGRNLSDLIAGGAEAPRLPLDEALSIAKQIASALEAAHEASIIHRDLKPANVKVRDDGTVKVLDFGLAKALDPTGAASSPDAMQSPTMTSPALTAMGVILGTAAYMAPEQAKGKTVDQRADVWAFGVVFYEMLTGERAFPGDDISETLASVLAREPDLAALPADTPAPVRRLVARCLEKDPKKRIRAVGDAMRRLDEDLAAGAARETDPEAVRAPGPRRTGRERLAWAVAAVATLALVGLGARALLSRGGTPARALHLSVPAALGGDVWLDSDGPGYVAIDPAGTTIVVRGMPHRSAGEADAGGSAGAPRLYVRRLDQSAATPLPGTEGAVFPFFSPDGEWVGFWSRGTIKKIRIGGGEAVQLCRTTLPRGADWGDDGFVYFSLLRGPVQRVPEDGGQPEPATELRDGELSHRWPHVVRGHGVILYSSFVEFGLETAVIYAERLSTRERREVARQGSDGRFVSTGHVVFARSDSLAAVPFDPDTLAAGGVARPVVGRTRLSPATGQGGFTASDNGVLVYHPVPERFRLEQWKAQLVWVDRAGRETPARPDRGFYGDPRLSPDDTRIAVELYDVDEATQIWVYDTVRGTMAKRTTEGSSLNPVWTPDGRRITYSGARADGSHNVYWRPADGSGAEERLTNDPALTQYPNSWSADGRVLTIEEVGGGLSYLTMDGGPTRHPLLESSWNKDTPVISPDGRWLAYGSQESGRVEIVVQPFPALDAKYVISSGGGQSPRWSRDSRQLFYTTRGTQERRALMAVSITTTPSFSASKPTMLFEGPYGEGFDVAADGNRFVMVKGNPTGPDETELRVIVNWTSELTGSR